MRNATDLTVVLDRSCSMSTCKEAMEEALNSYVTKQKEEPGECRFTLVTFDDTHEIPEGFNGVPIKYVGAIKLDPRGSTALLDALGSTVDNIGTRLAALPERDRPNKVLVVVVTDGDENSSRDARYINHDPAKGPKSALISAKIQHQRDAYKWEFIFLGANQDAIATACRLGMNINTAINFISSGQHQNSTGAASRLNKMSSCYRAASSADVGTQVIEDMTKCLGANITDQDTQDYVTNMQGAPGPLGPKGTPDATGPQGSQSKSAKKDRTSRALVEA